MGLPQFLNSRVSLSPSPSPLNIPASSLLVQQCSHLLKKMLQDIDDSVSNHRLQVITEASANIMHNNRKRKCHGERLEQPTPKHTRPESNSEPSSFQMHLISESTSEPDSVKDSNSLPKQSDSISSSYGQTKSCPECSNAYEYSHMVGGEYDSCESVADGQLGYSNLVDHHLLELELHGNSVSFECENDKMELGEEDKDLEDLLYSDCSEVNPNMLVLSSGRWVIKEAAQSATRKPTIDQEFEQYFSTLML
ncbi:unnamed protein product [Rhodiola kirilowii]